MMARNTDIAESSSGMAAIVLDEMDAVATALRPLEEGSDVTIGYPGRQVRIRITEDIPIYHKVALIDMPAQSNVRKQGHVIGVTTQPIRAGGLVHVHNLAGKDPGTDRPEKAGTGKFR